MLISTKVTMETMKLKKMMKNVEDALAAATFAEAGEAVTARSILKEGRKVLLALKEGRIDAMTLKYALNTAKRIDAHLDILYVTSPAAGACTRSTPCSYTSSQNSRRKASSTA